MRINNMRCETVVRTDLFNTTPRPRELICKAGDFKIKENSISRSKWDIGVYFPKIFTRYQKENELYDDLLEVFSADSTSSAITVHIGLSKSYVTLNGVRIK
jgi:hypothetical protein